MVNKYFKIQLFIQVEFLVNISIATKLQQYESGSLQCKTLDDSMISQIVWYKDNRIIEKNNTLDIYFDDSATTLTFYNLSNAIHSGQYKCSVKISVNNQIMNSSTFSIFAKCKYFLSLSLPISNSFTSLNNRWTALY